MKKPETAQQKTSVSGYFMGRGFDITAR